MLHDDQPPSYLITPAVESSVLPLLNCHPAHGISENSFLRDDFLSALDEKGQS
jgi:hypothetical protein